MGRSVREHGVHCADCCERMRLRGKSRLQYVCPCCGGSLIARPDGKPMGVPGTQETRRWRRRAHTVFDRLWRTGDVTRSSAQRWLARELGIPRRQCHFSSMESETLEQVVRICNDLQEGKRPGPTSRDHDRELSQHRRQANEAVNLLRRAGAHPTALRYWIAHHAGCDVFKDAGGLTTEQCQRLIRRSAQVFFEGAKPPRGTKLDRKLKLVALRKLRAP